MGNASSFVGFVKDQLSPLPELRSVRLFGGEMLSSLDLQFALIINDVLYFLVDDTTRAKYEAMGSECFSYNKKGSVVQVKKYYAVPADMLEEQDELLLLAQEAVRVARSRRATEKPKIKKSSVTKVASKKPLEKKAVVRKAAVKKGPVKKMPSANSSTQLTKVKVKLE